ncbi:hypothetical protein DPMN_182534 [Dreissena polymorpha]|uniref:Uncharacterized protein n=1 Tax=Dreissena polymorpha TaxID=45954 RepID=A0A9D4DED4_DREPO|nr:hypothetical protein DPMN_182534 [Dreissena polymorpha]
MKSLIGGDVWEKFECDFPSEHRSFIECDFPSEHISFINSFIEESRTFSRVISKDTTIYMPLDKTLQSYATDETGHSIKSLNHDKYETDESPVEYPIKLKVKA